MHRTGRLPSRAELIGSIVIALCMGVALVCFMGLGGELPQ